MEYSRNEEKAFKLGFTIDKDGNVTNPKGGKVKGRIDLRGYLIFSVKYKKIYTIKIGVHRFQAYFKFGDEIYKNEVVVRHLNGNPLDNSWNNIEIGSQQENNLDKLPEVRTKAAYLASRKKVKFNDDIVKQIRLDYKNGLNYRELMSKYGIKSKGTISYIVKKRILDVEKYINDIKK